MKQRLFDYITKSNWYQSLIKWLKNARFRRRDNLSLYEIVRIFFEKISQDDIIERANAVAFNFTLAIFPGVIFLFTLIPFVHMIVPSVSQESIMEFISNFMPPDMYSTVFVTVNDIVTNARGGLLTFGGLASLYLATNGMMSLMKAFNACYSTHENRGFFKMRGIAFMLTLMFAVVLIVATVLLVVGNIFVDYVQSNNWIGIEDVNFFLLFMLRFVILFAFFYFAISFMYYYGPAVHYNWKFFSIGSMIATILCIAALYIFTYYLDNFANYNKFYGSLGVLIAIMIFIEIISIIILVGYEVNASIHKAHVDKLLNSGTSPEGMVSKE
jgi:membrane protein